MSRFWTPEELSELRMFGSRMNWAAGILRTAYPKLNRSAVSIRIKYGELRDEALAGCGPRDTTPAPPLPDIPIDWDDEGGRPTFVERETRKDLPSNIPPAAPATSELDTDVVNLMLAFKQKGEMGIDEACDALQWHPKRLRAAVAESERRGYKIGIVGDVVGKRPAATALKEGAITIESAGDRHMFLVVGDPHVGSKHFMRAQLQDFIDKGMARAHARGLRSVMALCAGDFLDGVYPFSRWEQYAKGYEQQANAAADGDLPHREGLHWYGISGNHDETFEDRSGMITHRALVDTFRSRGRSDLTMLGARGAYLRIGAPGERGLFVELWHPRGSGGAYALSYNLQKKIESYQPGQKPDVLLCGHYHMSAYVPVRGVHGIMTGCWQNGQSSFGKSLKGAPRIGSWIIEYAQTPGGTVRDFSCEWVEYFEVERVREVGLG